MTNRGWAELAANIADRWDIDETGEEEFIALFAEYEKQIRKDERQRGGNDNVVVPRNLIFRLVVDCSEAALTPDRKWLAVLIRPEDAQLLRKALEE